MRDQTQTARSHAPREGVERGSVKWFDETKHFGFIVSDLGGKEIFFHESDIDTMEKTIEKGERVEFEVKDGPKGLKAFRVRPMGEE